MQLSIWLANLGQTREFPMTEVASGEIQVAQL